VFHFRFNFDIYSYHINLKAPREYSLQYYFITLLKDFTGFESIFFFFLVCLQCCIGNRISFNYIPTILFFSEFKMGNSKSLSFVLKRQHSGTFLVVQCLRICLPVGTWARSLAREDPACLRATKLMHHNS